MPECAVIRRFRTLTGWLIIIVIQPFIASKILMAKNFTHLKPSVFQAYDQGKSALEVMKFFKIPRSTAYDWHKEYRESKLPKSPNPKNPEPPQLQAPLEVSKVEVLEPSRPFRVINGCRCGEELSDFQLARRTLREIINDTECSDAVRLQATLGLLKLVPMKAELPKHVLEDQEQTSLQAERKKLEGMSVEELAKEYKRELNLQTL
jgi:transposase